MSNSRCLFKTYINTTYKLCVYFYLVPWDKLVGYKGRFLCNRLYWKPTLSLKYKGAQILSDGCRKVHDLAIFI